MKNPIETIFRSELMLALTILTAFLGSAVVLNLIH